MAENLWGIDLPNKATRFVFNVQCVGQRGERKLRVYAVRAFRCYVENATGQLPPLRESVDFLQAILDKVEDSGNCSFDLSLPIGNGRTWATSEAYAAACAILGCLGIMFVIEGDSER